MIAYLNIVAHMASRHKKTMVADTRHKPAMIASPVRREMLPKSISRAYFKPARPSFVPEILRRVPQNGM